MSLIVTVTTGLALLQDPGRHGMEHLGIPAAGPWHTTRYRQLADLLDEESPTVLEILNGTVHLTANEPTLIAVTGPGHVRANNTTLAAGMTYLLDDAETLSITSTGPGPTYVGAPGLTTPAVLGSTSTDTLSRLGPSPVTTGLHLPTARTTDNPGRFITRPERPATVLHYIPGPHITDDTLEHAWTIRSTARTGTRLTRDGITPLPAGGGVLPSLPTLPGTIQIPPDGQPIILGPDSGVTGGYPVAGVITTADLPHLATLQPGQTITLAPTTVPDAVEAHRKARTALNRLVTTIEHLS